MSATRSTNAWSKFNADELFTSIVPEKARADSRWSLALPRKSVCREKDLLFVYLTINARSWRYQLRPTGHVRWLLHCGMVGSRIRGEAAVKNTQLNQQAWQDRHDADGFALSDERILFDEDTVNTQVLTRIITGGYESLTKLRYLQKLDLLSSPSRCYPRRLFLRYVNSQRLFLGCIR